MKSKPNSALRFIGVILYITGILAGSALVALSAWGDIEASTFDAALQTDETLRSLECPVFIGKEENSVIAAEIDNTTERDVWCGNTAEKLKSLRESLPGSNGISPQKMPHTAS